MGWQAVASSAGIALGALVMVVSIFRVRRVFRAVGFLPEAERAPLLRFLNFHRLLMAFFLVGYAVVLAGILLDLGFLGNLFVAAIFLFGALFVFIGIVLQERLVSGILDRAEAELKVFKHMIDAAGDGLVLLDGQGRVEYCNRALKELLGYTSEELQGRSPCETFVPREASDPAPEAGRYFACLRKGVEGRTVEFDAFHKEGRRIPVELTASAFTSGGETKELGSIRDITGRREVEQQLRGAAEIAESANRAKSEFLANMSHEIRTPMNGIMGMTELALETNLTLEQREYLELVKTSADALLGLINDILDFSKVEAGMLELETIDFRLRDTLGNTLNTLALRAHQKGLELAFDIPPEIPDALLGDPGRIRQVVTNLVGNAIKFTSQGEVLVEVRTERPGERETVLCIAVKDTGIGIAPDKQEAIFDSFTQADGSITRRFGGTGLGLAISRRLVELMGGRIWVESEEGRGSTFFFTCRLGIQSDPPEPAIPARPEALRSLPVLIVDDNATNRRILVQMVSNWGMRPTAVESGPQALAAMERAVHADVPFPLLLIDGNMPEMDGFTLAEKIKSNPRVASSRLVMLTSAGRRGDANRCKELGISGYLMKPVKQSDLYDAIATVLGASPGERESGRLVTRHSLREETRKYRILLAEDNPVNQRVAIRVLEKRGHQVTLACNGLEVLEKLDQGSFDVVLMDIQMPEMDGLEATRIIRKREEQNGTHIPIIAMTAHAMKGDREMCLDAGMDEYVPKPLKPVQLFTAMNQLLSGGAEGRMTAQEAGVPTLELDREAILANLEGDEELLAEIIQMFIEDAPNLLERIRTALGEGGLEEVQRNAHALKGAVGNFGKGEAYAAAQTMEQHGREGELASAREHLAVLEGQMASVVQALAQLSQQREG
jgi:two-component system sensor histidine kinase/response regulator